VKIGIFSDVHGNALAFKQCIEVLTDKIRVDRLIFLGDSVGYFTDINPIIDYLRLNSCTSLLGNHDAMLLGLIEIDRTKNYIYKLKECDKVLSEDNRNFIKTLKPLLSERIEGRKILFVHGSPTDPLNGYIYPDTDLTKITTDHDIVFMGHTHRSFIKKNGNTVFVNVGSVGLPRDCGNYQSFCVFETNSGEVEIYKNKLDTERILTKYKNTIDDSVEAVLKRNHLENIKNLKVII
jgi:putative phosphoesterase